MGKVLHPSVDELRVIREKIKKVRDESRKQSDDALKGFNAYHRMPLGNEKDGRAKYIASDSHNHVESTYPHLIKQFGASDQKIVFAGPDERVAKILKALCREALYEQGGYKLISDVIKDGLIANFGVAKLYWKRVWGKSTEGAQTVDLETLQGFHKKAEQTGEVEVLETVEIPGDIERAIDDSDPDNPFMVDVQAPPTYQVKLRVTPLEESGPSIICVPRSEFVAERGKERMNDRKGCGHVRKMLVGELMRLNEQLSQAGGEPYYRNLKVAAEATETDKFSQEEFERVEMQRLHYEPQSDSDTVEVGVGDDKLNLRKEGQVVEWCDYVVVGKRLVPAIFTWFNDTILRVEENEDGIIPWSGWSPIISSHSIFGYGVSWLHAEDQNYRTLMARAVLDQVAFAIDKVRMVANRGVDVLGFRDLYPGKVVYGRKEDVQDLDTGTVDSRIFQVLEWIKGEGEERGPGTRYNQGTDAESLNHTATGMKLIQRASMSKIDMYSLAFAELFLVDVYNKLAFLFQQNLDKPRMVSVDGQTFEVTRDMIQGDYRARADLGMQVDFDDREFGKAMTMWELQNKANEKYPFFTGAQMFEYFKKILVAAGERNTSLFAGLPEGLEGWTPQIQAAFAAMQMQMQQQMEAAGGAPGGAAPPAPGGGPPQAGGEFVSGDGSSAPSVAGGGA